MPVTSTPPLGAPRTDISDSHRALAAYLGRVLPQYIRRLALQHERGLISLSLKVPRSLLDRHALHASAEFYYSRNHDALQQFGLGCCLQQQASGPERFQTLQAFFQRLQSQWQWFDPDQTGLEPRAHCVFAYAPQEGAPGPWDAFPNTWLQLPRLAVALQGREAGLTFNVQLEQSTSIERLVELCLSPLHGQPPHPAQVPAPSTTAQAIDYREHQHWLDAVRHSLDCIGKGSIDKLVLTRMATHRLNHTVPIDELAAGLRQRFPNCTVFAARIGEQHFICATPEQLLRLQAGRLHCDAIGGTIGRGADATQDRYLGKRLLADPKARHEHRLVVEAIAGALAPFSDKARIPDTPCLLRLPNLQHLWTPIEARLRPGRSLFELIEALHPTPAVGGFPSHEAKRWLAQHETTPRGWYSGAAGWIDRQGQGELAVLLRAALLSPGKAQLFAGAGIVADSDPELEWEETEMKLAAMREALGISTGLLQGVSS